MYLKVIIDEYLQKKSAGKFRRMSVFSSFLGAASSSIAIVQNSLSYPFPQFPQLIPNYFPYQSEMYDTNNDLDHEFDSQHKSHKYIKTLQRSIRAFVSLD